MFARGTYCQLSLRIKSVNPTAELSSALARAQIFQRNRIDFQWLPTLFTLHFTQSRFHKVDERNHYRDRVAR
ncbi:Uncharacterised protein [Vibrio cholerae]|nr:Uncharacterised protein [Vibrio cholerae]